ncbi:MAG: MiaB/RimO family radical SAM methylthiotransferase [Gemmatimonadales bacterium]|nr:MAG: MiaB/RimO family radical SAM methylthiotransferase [Gemmatimonadales bacterium]
MVGRAPVRVAYHTFGCKANQYDTERMRQELEARGTRTVPDGDASGTVHVVNTCTVTNRADADARRLIRRIRRDDPLARIVVAGCSAALKASQYRAMDETSEVVPGHDPVAVAQAVVGSGLVQLELRGRDLHEVDREPVGAELLLQRKGAARGWLKIQDGCDRQCAFCATRLARGRSRSRSMDEVVEEARLLARSHAELVLTGIHIGHFGLDLSPRASLGELVARLLDQVPGVRLRLGSVEATEVDDLLLSLLADSDGRLVPHLHMPLQSGADPVLRRMRRWHTREMYRVRAWEITERLTVGGAAPVGGVPVLGLGADIITGFPGETEEDHAATVALVEELPYTYLHVFPFSPRDDTVAAELEREMPVPQRVAGERSRELRDIVQAKGEAYRRARAGSRARVVLEGKGRSALTEDYLRVAVRGPLPPDRRGIHEAELVWDDGELWAVLGEG